MVFKTFRVAASMTVTVPSLLFGTQILSPPNDTGNGSSPTGMVSTTVSVSRSTTDTVSSVRFGIHIMPNPALPCHEPSPTVKVPNSSMLSAVTLGTGYGAAIDTTGVGRSRSATLPRNASSENTNAPPSGATIV